MAGKRTLDVVTVTETVSVSPATVNTIRQLLLSYQREGIGNNLDMVHLRKRHRQLVAFFTWLEGEAKLTTLAAISQQDAVAYLAHRRELGRKPATVKNTYRILRAWFAWLEREGTSNRAAA